MRALLGLVTAALTFASSCATVHERGDADVIAVASCDVHIAFGGGATTSHYCVEYVALPNAYAGDAEMACGLQDAGGPEHAVWSRGPCTRVDAIGECARGPGGLWHYLPGSPDGLRMGCESSGGRWVTF